MDAHFDIDSVGDGEKQDDDDDDDDENVRIRKLNTIQIGLSWLVVKEK